jgi:hypothetical protein
MRAKCADYFAAGTQVVWDVDLQREDVMKSYKASDPDNPVIFRHRGMADAEPAVPEWRRASSRSVPASSPAHTTLVLLRSSLNAYGRECGGLWLRAVAQSNNARSMASPI